MEARGDLAGVAKIIPPPEWKPRKNDYDIDHMPIVIPQPSVQIVTGQHGSHQQVTVANEQLTVQQYHQLVNEDQYRTPKHIDHEELERKYWRSI